MNKNKIERIEKEIKEAFQIAPRKGRSVLRKHLYNCIENKNPDLKLLLEICKIANAYSEPYNEFFSIIENTEEEGKLPLHIEYIGWKVSIKE